MKFWQRRSFYTASAQLAARAIGPRKRKPAPEGDDHLSEEGTLGEGQRPHNHAYLMQVVQPALAGLMDGSVSTLAPLFATAFATHSPMTTFYVGLAAALGAGISMAFSEGLSDDGTLTGRGNPIARGGITGLMTFFGGIGHALPFLISNIHLALVVAYAVVGLELIAIAYIRYRYFRVSMVLSIIQVIFGGALVFFAGVIIGSHAHGFLAG